MWLRDQPGSHWETDFTGEAEKIQLQISVSFTDTFSGWEEAFPIKNETAQMVVTKLLSDIIPR